uniref:U7 snRNA-associated Sm-like protein LSm11 n=1 Tax=Oncorhynchus gorbuscha TaxID=8017 RepID=UPI001EAEEA7B|nr:U7 snRNA-associated Sm-like protein LSm11 [Oncorhynchus gorbuscha]
MSAFVLNMEERERRGDKQQKCPESEKKERESTSACASDATEHTAEEEDDIAAKLDVTSDKFDPLLALYSTTVPLPYPNVKCFNNIAEYESFLKGGRGRAKPENVEKKQRKARKGVADPERIEKLKRLMVNNPIVGEDGEEGTSGTARRCRIQKAAKNVLTRMPLHTGSPLGEMHRCVQERIRVKVHIRTFKGLRGVCSGFIVAFDKFWNMAMVDVDETYREPLLGEALYHEKALTVTRLFDKLKLQESEALREYEEKKKQIDKKKAEPFHPPPETQTRDCRRGDPNRGDPRRRGDPRAVDPRLARATVEPPVGDDPGALGATGKTQGSNVKGQESGTEGPKRRGSQKKEVSQPYGRVHTRHVNQLFIRGENVLLVNLQPL